jgi:hypothetical protein
VDDATPAFGNAPAVPIFYDPSLIPIAVEFVVAQAKALTLAVTEGATLRGRVVQGGKPVSNAEIGLPSGPGTQGGERALLLFIDGKDSGLLSLRVVA